MRVAKATINPMQPVDGVLHNPVLVGVWDFQHHLICCGELGEGSLGIRVQRCQRHIGEAAAKGEEGRFQPGAADLEDIADTLEEFEHHADVFGHGGTFDAIGGQLGEGDPNDGGDDGVREHGVAVDGADVIDCLAIGCRGQIMIFEG